MNSRIRLGRLIAILAILLVAVLLLAEGVFPQGHYEFVFPLTFQNGNRHTTLKGCGGCTIAQMRELGATWSYAWVPDCLVIPMQKPHRDTVREAKASARREGWLLWGNEPDLEGPIPVTAAYLYPDAEALGVNLVLATGSHLDADLSWSNEFRKAYQYQHNRNPGAEALATHCYFGPNTVQDCVDHVARVVQLAEECGIREVWVTEFACAPMTSKACFPAAEEFIRWMKEEEMVTRYAWFAAKWEPNWPETLEAGALFDEEGITPVGLWYAEQ